MNNPSYVYIPTDKLVTLIETSCPPVCSIMTENVCNEYGGNCNECWKSWFKDGNGDG